MNKKQGIFSMWLKNFLCLVFTQAFQAIFLAVIVLIIGKILGGVSHVKVTKDDFVGFVTGSNTSTKYFICSIVAYVGVTGLIKLDKLVRSIFGIDESPLFGDLSKEMHKLMHAGMGMMKMAGDVKRNVSDVQASKARLKNATNATQRIALNTGKIDALAAGTKGGNTNNTSNTNVNINSGGGKGFSRDQIAALFGNAGNFDENGNLIDRSAGEQMLYDAQTEEHEARRALSNSRRKAAVTALSTIAGLGIANGASDSPDETFMVGAALSHGLGAVGNVATKGIEKSSARMTAAKELRNAQSLVENANNENRKILEKNAEIMSQAIADSTRDVAKDSFKIDSLKHPVKLAKKAVKQADENVRKAADDWLNTDISTDKSSRITRSSAKTTVRENAKKYDNKK